MWVNSKSMKTSPPTPLLVGEGIGKDFSLPYTPLSKGGWGDSCGVGGLGFFYPQF